MTLTESQIIILVFSSLVISLLVLVLIAVALWKINDLKKKNAILFSGKKASSLESILIENSKSIKEMDKEIQELFEISNKIHNLSFKGLHKFAVIRFNPFKDIGGNQSFVVALLDGKNSGIVISSLHTREGTRVYAKPVIKGKCEEYQLTEEEIKAISIASLNKGVTV